MWKIALWGNVHVKTQIKGCTYEPSVYKTKTKHITMCKVYSAIVFYCYFCRSLSLWLIFKCEFTWIVVHAATLNCTILSISHKTCSFVYRKKDHLLFTSINYYCLITIAYDNCVKHIAKFTIMIGMLVIYQWYNLNYGESWA